MSSITGKDNTNSTEHLYASLRNRILNEYYFAGEKLSENSLAQEFKCSRTPIREALKKLEQDGLISVKPKSGSYVRIYSGQHYRDLVEVRSYLEGLAFRLAIERKTDTSLLEQLNQEMDEIIARTPIDMMAYAEIHYRFHREFVRISGNELLESFFEKLNLKSSHLFLQTMNIDVAIMTQEEHRHIIDLIKNADPKGEKFVIQHLWKKREYLN
ncbi:MAG TPA: GntR family transcriptional regulator [Spirochaetales bacterium]|nr:GntR family transcriptional regulator [Spirochaetales bacterium]